MMGDDGEKFGAWPTTYEHCWGEGRWVERFFEALEANARLADDGHAVRVAGAASRRSAASTCRRRSYAEMGEWALPPDETRACSRRCSTTAVGGHRPEARWLRGGFWRNFQVKYREINDLHKQMLRTSAKVAAMPTGAGRGRGAIDHLHRGQSNDCYWHGLFGGIYIVAHAAGDARAPDRGRGRGRPRARDARGRRAARTSTSTACAEVLLGDDGPGRGRQARRGRRDRLVGHPRGAARARGGAPPPARGVPRDAARPRGRRGDDPRDGERRHADGATATGGAPASIHDIVHGQGGRPRGAAVLRRPRAALRARPVPRAGHDARGVRDGRGDRAGRPSGRRRSPSTTSPPARSSLSRDGTVAGQPVTVEQDDPPRSATGWRPSSSSTSSSTTAATRPIDARLGPRAVAPPAGRRRQPVGVVRRRRRPLGPRRERAGRRASTRSATATTGSGVAVAATPEPAADAWWSPIETVSNSESGLRARLPGQQPAALVAAAARARARPAGSRCARRSAVARDRAADGGGRRPREPTSPATDGDAAAGSSSTPTSTSRCRVDPFTGRVPDGRLGGAVPRLERADHRRSATARSRSAGPPPTSRGTWARR